MEKIKKESNNLTANKQANYSRAKLITGLSVIGIGALILMSQLGFDIPDYLYSWPVILILIGIIMLIKHNFRKTSAYVLIAIGSIFLLNDFYPHVIEMRFIYPTIIIIVGVSIVLKAMKKTNSSKITIFAEEKDSQSGSNEDFVSSTALFGGVTKNIVSKNFQGAQITTVFGGIELNLIHADFQNQAIIDLNCIFGGVTILVPTHWKVVSELTTVFGGIDDKRPSMSIENENVQTLILKGSCVFGGIEIANYA